MILISEIFRVHPTRPLQMFHVATQTSSGEIQWIPKSVCDRRGDLQGITIKGAAIPYKPYLLASRRANKTTVKFSGYLMNLWKELEQRMNFTTQFVVPKESVFGFLLDNGSWSGAVGMVVNKEVDVGISFFAYLLDRLDAVDFLPPIWNVKLMVHIKQPEMQISTFEHVLSPFACSLWWLIVLAMCILTVLLSFTWSLGHKSDESTSYKLIDSALCVFGAFCQQGHDSSPQSPSSRVVYFMMYFTAVVLFVAYSAIFISFLTIRRADLPFTDFQGLLKDGTYKLGLLSGSARINFFKKSKVLSLRRVYWDLIHPGIMDLPSSDVEGLHRICQNSRYSYILSTTTLRGLARSIPCSIVGVPKAYYSITASMIISKSSPYKRLFRHHVEEIRRTGVLNRIQQNAWPPKFVEILEDPPSSVSLETVTIFHIVLVVGVVIAITVLLLEFLAATIDKCRRLSYLPF